MDHLDSRIRREELRYAAFRAQRHHLSTTMLPHEYVAFANSVSMRLVFYDPNFDFRFASPASLTASRPEKQTSAYLSAF